MKNDIEQRIAALLEYVTPVRRETLYKVLSYRTRYFAVMLENIYQPHNASAVLRSCDAFGIQDIHVIEQHSTFKPNQEVAMGSAKWLSVHNTMNPIEEVYTRVRAQGYKIIATSLQDENTISLNDFDISQPSVLVFGNELKGLSQEAIEYADTTMKISMFGFVESFNISVSVAIALSHIITKLHNSDIDWKLSKEESNETLIQWLRSDIHKSEEIEQRIFGNAG